MNDDIEAIRRLIPLARQVAKGSVDPLYDAIADGEALLAGKPTLGSVDAATVRRWLEERVNRGW